MDANGRGDDRDTGRAGASGAASPAGDRTTTRSLPGPTAWPTITTETRPWTRWWWMGSAVEPGHLERELSRLDDAGIGGVEITPIYGVRGEEHHNLDFLGDEWLRRLDAAVGAAREREMGVDLVPGTGWHYGGPGVDYGDSAMDLDAETFAPDGTFEASFDPERLRTVVAYGADRSVELTDCVDDDGRIEWPVPDGEWRVVAVSGAPGRQVKRAAPDRQGMMVNPFYPAAMERYLRRFDGEFAGYDGPPLRGVFHDSFEFGATWSPVLLEMFERERGYRLQDHLPALIGAGGTEGSDGDGDGDGSGDPGDEDAPPADGDDTAVPERAGLDETARVRADYRRTLSALYEETISTWRQWAHRNGWQARFQAHCAPGNLLDLYARGDIPETEFIGEKRCLLGSKMASSAAHVAGKRLVSAETATWLDGHFTTTLAEIRTHVDELFLAGVNHVVYHGTAYGPDDAPWPGWLFYASTQLNPRNPIWRDFPALNDYVTRCQSVLQSGDPDADVLLYWPVEDVWHAEPGLAPRLDVINEEWFDAYPFGRLARRLHERGYAVDYVSDRQLEGATVAGGRLELPGGDYRALLLPETGHLPVGTLRTVLDLAEEGATVGFEELPGDVPGLGSLEERRSTLAELLADLPAPGGDGAVAAAHGDGRVLVGDAAAMLPRTDARREPLVDAGLQFVRRTFDGGTHYFVVNRGDDLDGWATLSVDAASVLRLDPTSGETNVAASRPADDGTEVYLRLGAGESVVLRAFDERRLENDPGGYWTAAGDPVSVEGPWEVAFVRGGPERPPDAELDALRSWTDLGEAYRRFAGTVRYATSFELEKSDAGGPWWLDAGTVHESARFWLDGRELGTAIDPPYRVPLDSLAAGEHTLRVEVTNLAANRIRDLDRRGVDWKCFEDINLVNRDYEPFDAADWPVRPSGLLGPVELVPRRPVDPTGR
jgi:hypothetical protein